MSSFLQSGSNQLINMLSSVCCHEQGLRAIRHLNQIRVEYQLANTAADAGAARFTGDDCVEARCQHVRLR